MQRVLILGITGKMGRALADAFVHDYDVRGLTSNDCNAADTAQLEGLIHSHQPDIVINTVAYLGIDPCAENPADAFALNSALPRRLAELSNQEEFLLIHFSTDAVFADRQEGYFVESDRPEPMNVYGISKLAGDWSVMDLARRYYLVRIAVLFGPHSRPNQFVEKMLQRAQQGSTVLRIADDIVTTPCYSMDVANRIRSLVESDGAYGLYHMANHGRASLYDLIRAIAGELQLPVKIEPASHKDFPAIGRKNACTPLSSSKIEPLRHWREAVQDYCRTLTL
jgi:dTDP-4-dehydrorhamnose reductase